MRGNLKPKVAIAVFCLAAMTQLHAENPSERLFRERWADHLPEWCLYTQLLPDRSYSFNYGDPQSEEYRRFFGSAWPAMHHYCFGLALVHEAESAEDKATRDFKFRDAVQEFDYVLRNSRDDFRLRPELLVQRGAALEAVEEYVGAVDSYTDAIRLDGEYEPAYVGLSNCFEALGDPGKALAIIDAALQRVPRSEILLGRREELMSRGSREPDSTSSRKF